jgi:hypothetical protein
MSKKQKTIQHHKPAPKPKAKAKKSKTLVADCSGSDCFSELIYKDGQIFGTFARDGYQEIWDTDKRTAQEWFNSGSLGGFYNSEIA